MAVTTTKIMHACRGKLLIVSDTGPSIKRRTLQKVSTVKESGDPAAIFACPPCGAKIDRKIPETTGRAWELMPMRLALGYYLDFKRLLRGSHV